MRRFLACGILFLAGSAAAFAQVSARAVRDGNMPAMPPRTTQTSSADSHTQRTQWEYAIIFLGTSTQQFSAPGKMINADSLSELHRKMGGKGEFLSILDLLNLAGNEGWEMVSANSLSSGNATQYVFKRPVR
jgi:hypothetical protein